MLEGKPIEEENYSSPFEDKIKFSESEGPSRFMNKKKKGKMIYQ